MEWPLVSFPTLRVLTLESAQEDKSTLTDALHVLGVSQILKAVNVAYAIEILCAGPEKFDVAILDLDVENMDGIELVRRASQNSDQAFILMSSHDEELQSSLNAFACQCRLNILGVLSKPVTNRQLAVLLARYGRSSNKVMATNGAREFSWRREDLVSALAGDQFIPFFQPQIELATGCVTSVEVLARWNHPELGLLPPSQFIHVMEREGLLYQLFDNLLLRSFICAQQWDARGWSIGLAINVSPSTLQDSYLPSRVSEMANQHRICPERLTLEVTETAMTKNPGKLLENLIRLRLRGFKLSVDDFGSGYSSLQQLSEMPFTEIKIDRSLVGGITHSRKAVLILESILGLANKLDMCTVAEGIESEIDHELVHSLGCRFGQSYYFAKPMGNTELVRHLSRNNCLRRTESPRQARLARH